MVNPSTVKFDIHEGDNLFEYEIPNAKWANVDLVGEYYRQSSIVSVIGGRPKGDDSKQVEVKIHLIPEPDNPYGSQGRAISARINGKLVGYLSNEDAEKWYRDIHRITASGAIAVTVGNVLAYNRTKWDKNGRTKRELEINIRVALPEPGLLLPLNTQNGNDIAVLPWGSALQVVGEDNHLHHLFEYVPVSGEGLVILTMHRIENTLKNGSVKELVEVRLDGERVGQLTPASSRHFLPAIAHTRDAGKTLAVWSKLKGSGIAVELTVQGARATDLNDDWLRGMPSLPTFIPEAEFYEVPDAYVPDNTKPYKENQSTNIVSDDLSTFPSSEPTGPTSAPALEYLGDQENTATYRNGKRSVKFGDKQRRFSPVAYSTAAWTSLIALNLIGMICIAGAPIGLIFTAIFVTLSILFFRGQRLMAEALRFERAERDT